MKKNGFTLTELIGVLVILAALSLIAIPVITKNIKEGEEQAYNDQINSIKLALEIWMIDNGKPGIGETITITLSQLKYSGLIDLDVKNPKTEEFFPNDMELSMTNNGGVIEYVFNEEGTNKEEYVNIPSIKINGNVLEYVEIGSEYVDLGAIAKSSENVELEVSSVEEPALNTNELGGYIIKYTASDETYTNTVYRNVIVRDTTAPVITYTIKELTVNLSDADSYDYLADVTATDNSGGEVSITVEKDFKPILGNYSIKYIATDESGNTTTIYRKVVVEPGDDYVLIGDIDNNRIINGDDATLALQLYTGIYEATFARLTAADVNKDGIVSPMDSTLILEYETGSRSEGTQYINTWSLIKDDIVILDTTE